MTDTKQSKGDFAREALAIQAAADARIEELETALKFSFSLSKDMLRLLEQPEGANLRELVVNEHRTRLAQSAFMVECLSIPSGWLEARLIESD